MGTDRSNEEQQLKNDIINSKTQTEYYEAVYDYALFRIRTDPTLDSKTENDSKNFAEKLFEELGYALPDTPKEDVILLLHITFDAHATAKLVNSGDRSKGSVPAKGDPILMFNGQFVHEFEDLRISGAGMEFVFKRTYKNQVMYNGPLGFNWSHNYNLWLRISNESIPIFRCTGSMQEEMYVRHPRFDESQEYAYWIPPDGQHGVIRKSLNGVYFWLSPDGDRYAYESHPADPFIFQIRKIVDKHGNYLEFEYSDIDRLLRKVYINSPNRFVQFNYEQNRIISFEDYVGRTCVYEYDDFGDLIAAATPSTKYLTNGLLTRYEYSSSEFASPDLQHNLYRIIDPSGHTYLENAYGSTPNTTSYNRVNRQIEGNGERFFEYEDIVQEFDREYSDIERPAHQTNLRETNGHLIHFVYNKFGNLLLREEKIIQNGISNLITWRYRFNSDGGLIAVLSPEGLLTQFYYGRDHFQRHNTIADNVNENAGLTFQKRMTFGNILAVVRRSRRYEIFNLGFDAKGIWGDFFDDIIQIQNRDRETDSVSDIIIKYTYEPDYQQMVTISDPRFTESADPDYQEKQEYLDTLVKFQYTGNRENPNTNLYLKSITYPSVHQPDGTLVTPIVQQFAYDNKGRLIELQDANETITKFEYLGIFDVHKEGYLKRITIDPGGLNIITNYEMNDVGVTTSTTNGRGFRSEFEVDSLNRVVKSTTTPPFSFVIDYSYDKNSNLERTEHEIKDENGIIRGIKEVKIFRYNELNKIILESIGGEDLSKHLVTRYIYDESNMLIRTILPKGNVIYRRYDARLLELSVTRGFCSETECKTRTVYNKDGLPYKKFNGNGYETTIEYDAFNRVTHIIDPKGNVDYTMYDKSGNVIMKKFFEKNTDGSYWLLTSSMMKYDERNYLTNKVEYLYQIPPKVINIHEDVFIQAEEVEYQYFYDKKGNLEKIINPKGQEQTYQYDLLDRKVQDKDSIGNYTNYSYDENSNLIREDVHERVSDADTGNFVGEDVFTTINTYDELDRLKSQKDSLGSLVVLYYDSRNNVVKTVDPLGNTKRLEYDIFGRKTIEISELTDTGTGEGQLLPAMKTMYEYDKNGNITAATDPNENRTLEEYDSLDRKEKIISADSSTQIFRYDCESNVVFNKDNNGLVRFFSYDSLGRTLAVSTDYSKILPGLEMARKPSFEAYSYDGLGRILSEKNDFSYINTRFDSLGRAYEETTSFFVNPLPLTTTIRREFDLLGNLIMITYPSRRVIRYDLDDLNRIVSIVNIDKGLNYPGSPFFANNYNILVNKYRGMSMSKTTYGNGSSVDYSYDGNGRIIQVYHKASDNSLTIQQLYDGAGNIRVKNDIMQNNNGSAESYKYNSAYWLTKIEARQVRIVDVSNFQPANVPLPPNLLDGQIDIDQLIQPLGQDVMNFTYRYDVNGNRTDARIGGEPNTYKSNILNEYHHVDSNILQYDLNGNLIRDSEKKYFYDYRNQLTQVKDIQTSSLYESVHDVRGRNIIVKSDKQELYLVYDGHNTIEEYVADLSPTRTEARLLAEYVNEYDADSVCQIAVQETLNDPGQEHWYHKDIEQSIRIMTDQNGNTSGSYRYVPYGNMTNEFGAYNPYRFKSRRFNKQTNVYDFRSRSYSPTLGRFLQRDTILAPNMYSFLENNPLTFTDPWGREKQSIFSRAHSWYVTNMMGLGEFENRDFVPGPFTERQVYNKLEESLGPAASYPLLSGDLTSPSAEDYWIVWSQALFSRRDLSREFYFNIHAAYSSPSFGYTPHLGTFLIANEGADLASSEAVGELTAGVMHYIGRGAGGIARRISKPLVVDIGEELSNINIKRVVGRKVAYRGAKEGKKIPELVFDFNKNPDLADNMWHAQMSGRSQILTHGGDKLANRKAAIRDIPRILSRDEYPFAFTLEGGGSSWIGHIPASQNSSQGAIIKNFITKYKLKPGDRFKVTVINHPNGIVK